MQRGKEWLPGQLKEVEYVPRDNIAQSVLRSTWKFIATKFISGVVRKKRWEGVAYIIIWRMEEEGVLEGILSDADWSKLEL